MDHLSKNDHLTLQLQYVDTCKRRMGNKASACPRNDHACILVKRDQESQASRSGRPPSIHSPSSMRCPKKLVDHRSVSGEQGRSKVNQIHPIDPSLFGFGDRRTLPPDLLEVLEKFGNVARWCGAASSGWQGLLPARRPAPIRT